jgi:DNA-binding CsgD family transcriptional regulator
MPSQVEPQSGHPKNIRPVRVWLGTDDIIRLEQETLRRVAEGRDRDENGTRINVNRSTIIRDLIDEHLPAIQ